MFFFLEKKLYVYKAYFSVEDWKINVLSANKVTINISNSIYKMGIYISVLSIAYIHEAIFLAFASEKIQEHRKKKTKYKQKNIEGRRQNTN